MNKTMLMNFLADKENKSIKVERAFDAPVDTVWNAWTNPEILDKWWAPKPWRAETKSMDFREGGRWQYAMVSPEGEKHWALFEYQTINLQKDYSGTDAFCDEQGNISNEMPRMSWKNTFTGNDDDTTTVNIDISFNELADLEKIMEMGFKEGFTMGLQNLDEWLEQNKNIKA